ncbi:MAG: hypothetical protein PCFJNLEI_03982 [Verrucomicrobiae bacterium]|nr:hypothetical protein [Verrucomicrobiae bacterium]
MFAAGADAGGMEAVEEFAGPADDFGGGFAPATFAQGVVAVGFEIEDRGEGHINAVVAEGFAELPAKVAGAVGLFDFSDTRQFADDGAEPVDAFVFLVNGDERVRRQIVELPGELPELVG